MSKRTPKTGNDVYDLPEDRRVSLDAMSRTQRESLVAPEPYTEEYEYEQE